MKTFHAALFAAFLISLYCIGYPAKSRAAADQVEEFQREQTKTRQQQDINQTREREQLDQLQRDQQLDRAQQQLDQLRQQRTGIPQPQHQQEIRSEEHT